MWLIVKVEALTLPEVPAVRMLKSEFIPFRCIPFDSHFYC